MFLTNTLNIIDIIAIGPYFVTIIIELCAIAEKARLLELVMEGSGEEVIDAVEEEKTDTGHSTHHYSDKVAFLAVMRIVRLLRIIRLAKLSRHSRNLNALVKATGCNELTTSSQLDLMILTDYTDHNPISQRVLVLALILSGVDDHLLHRHILH